ncbi:hypothetical protein QFZ77_002802 [Paenibacillus sp. V4I3]|uniref:hypothetical protein n=1 Tax=unclassified Paenibacillus TaxID=185978 RepID=UPI002783245B|nr:MULTISPECIES: hypothetical protein [unclassified Paenibacillus]MDQ0874143.1 hypothetical protein [Paenibacillus sp. V4I3]MDQ0889980.1 hypothetical protein [Paenibacillus sp. V4I9]
MLTNLLIIIGASIIGFLEAPALRRKKLFLESWVFFALLLAGTLLSILSNLRVNLPNPLDLITFVYKPVSDFVFGILK